MTIKCPFNIPDPGTAKTPKEKTGLKNAERFKAYVEEGLKADNLPMYNGFFNRKEAADTLVFSRSSYSTNDYIKAIAVWVDKQLGNKPHQSPASGKTQHEREIEKEVQRLKNRIAQLRVSLDEANARLREYGYFEEEHENGQVRLPW